MTKLDTAHRTPHTGNRTLKGQIWSVDFISGLMVVMFLMVMFIIGWNHFSIRWNSAMSYRELLVTALFATDALFTTPGDPAGWERLGNATSPDIRSLGLAYSRNEIDTDKLQAFAALNATNADYAAALRKLGMEGRQMNMRITDLQGESVAYEFGPVAGLNNSVVVERLVMLNGSVAKARVEVWK